ncbi:alkaline phosphatase family protein [Winogradskyella sp.]|uniref:alkaline phosphatase family protein n=1 Tax=Winogradskyella sp. TaxID=1883156 RepID=UPI001B0FDFBF|nr:alkaline phosphatase family protein [Winogradskyella sp.]MBO6879178.1 alkaline phosphatase family protein [Winogradskyella sp.]
MKKPKVLLIGWDAADWKIIWPLVNSGQMPALKGLMSRGVYGNMSTMNPPYSPMLWSSVATGKTPDKHGVLGFIEVNPDGNGIRPVTVNSRKVRALWNIFHNQGLKSNLVGWWPSFPAEPINGVVVSDKFQKVNKDPKRKTSIAKGTIHPTHFTEKIADLRMFPHEVTEAHILPFIPRASEINQEKDASLASFAKLLAENTSVHAAATNLMRTTDWDFMGIYYDLIDHFCHAFMKFHPPKLAAIPENKFQLYKDVIEGAYRYQDMMLERKLELIDEDTTVIVMSDHGYESGHRRILKMPKYPAAPALEHRNFGIFVAAGPKIKKAEKVFGLGLIDVAPTILHMFNLPVGKDMDGKVALEIFEEANKVDYIESWDKIQGDFGEHLNKEDQLLSDEETMKQLIELGYIDKPDDNIEIAVLKTNCDLKHNLARVYLGKKDFEKAKAILLTLVTKEYPVYSESSFKGKNKDVLERQGYKVGDSVIDKIPFYMDLLTIALSEKDYDLGEKYLKVLRRKDKRFEINTSVSEAKILLGQGKVKLALKCLEEARDKNPNSQVWYQIGKAYDRINDLDCAKSAFESAIKFEADSAKSHQALAKVLIELKEYEEAADHALTAIELVRYFPEAHYTLGRALEKMGHLEHAKQAYETAAMLKPKTFHRAESAIENINDALGEKISFKDKSSRTYKKDQIVIVSGLPRSGTSLMMQMLNAAGLDILTDENRSADASNPKGYYEYEPVMSLHKDNTWLAKAKNKSLKVVAPLLKFLNPEFRYKVIFMNRDLTEVVKSQQKMIGKDPETLPTKLLQAYEKHLKQVATWKDKEPGVELIYVNYKDVVDDASSVVDKLESFIGLELDKKSMTGCVDKNLYRNRVSK